MATKKRTTKRKTTDHFHNGQSFKIVKDVRPFLSFKATRQTAFWVILLAVIVILQLWIVKLQLDISVLTEALQK